MILYDLGIRFYYLQLWIASLFNRKARAWIKGRKGWAERLQSDIDSFSPIVWFHSSSLGEFEQGKPIIESWRKENPDFKILLTFFSPSGYENIKNNHVVDFIHYIPLDTRQNARKFIQIVKPKLVIFIKYEFWYHMLHEATNIGATAILVSSVFRRGQLFFKFYGKWYRKVLHLFNHIFVQDENSLDLLMNIDVKKVSIAGDTRFDRVTQIASQNKKIDIVESFTAGRFTYIFGSTWQKDEDIIIPYINSCKLDSCFIIAPHEIELKHIQQLENKLHKRIALFSNAYGKSLLEARVLIIDRIGLLSSIYRYGNVAYIGGGFGKGIHNILEPAVYGMPVVFGPRYQKFHEANALFVEGGAFSITNFEELKSIFDTLRENKHALEKASEATREFVQRNLGATQAILNYLKKI
jgi:3-deoxy-D-manno-octulosonic-acid transferase